MDVRDLNTKYATTETKVPLTQNKWTRLCGVDAGRWSLIFSIPSGQTTTPIGLNQVGTADGLQLTAQIPQITLTGNDCPGGVSLNWYAFTASVAASVTVFSTRDIEVPDPEEA